MTEQSRTVTLCIAGTQAEYGRRPDEAADCYRQAWDAVEDDYDACIAAHYLARIQPEADAVLHWNQLALAHADASGDERVQSFYPSLYVNLGQAYEALGQTAEAAACFEQAAGLGLVHKPDAAPPHRVAPPHR
jgi:tetratricopeptide (TPR) repeat protein